MSDVTRFATRVRAELREELLEAASQVLCELGYRGLRMADVARAVGVSRQTVYNEFGDKEQLAQAVLLRCTAHFLTDIDAAMDPTADVERAVRAGTLAALRHAERDPLIVALVTGGATGAAADLLPFLADRHAAPVLLACTDTVRQHLARLAVAGSGADLVAAAVVRLVVSHLLLPTDSPERAARDVAALATAALATSDPSSTTIPEETR